MNPDIIVYTDGSSRGNPGPGGYGIVMQKFGTDYLKEFSEGFKKTTNNRMELLAVIVALEKIKKEKQHGPLEYIPSFVRRKNGLENITYDIPEMEEYLKETYGKKSKLFT